MNWLLLIHHIPAKPSYLRAKIWRRLQQIGAVPLKQAVYAMPHQEENLEILTWIAKEIVSGGGEAMLLEAQLLAGLDDGQVTELFRQARRADYAILLEVASQLQKRWQEQPPDASGAGEFRATLGNLRKDLAAIAAIDFFPIPERAQAEKALVELEAAFRQEGATRAGSAAQPPELAALQGKTWVTRANVYVDRMASAWLIRRQLDPAASFKFVRANHYTAGPNEVRFDLPEGEFSHEGGRCTFEVLVSRFAANDRALGRLAGLVHDLDLHDDAYSLPETEGVRALLDGIVASTSDDQERLARAGVVFDSLLACFQARKKDKTTKEG